MRVVLKVIIAIVVLSSTYSFAQCTKTCTGRFHRSAQKKANVCDWSECERMISTLDLSEEQQNKFQHIKEDNAQEKSADGAKECYAAVCEMLTEEQMEQLNGMCKAKGMSCPIQNEDGKEVPAAPVNPVAVESPTAK